MGGGSAGRHIMNTHIIMQFETKSMQLYIACMLEQIYTCTTITGLLKLIVDCETL